MAGGTPTPNWEGLLKWSIANSDGTSAPRQVSEEEQRWFHEAMQGQTIDVIRRMKEITLVMNMPEQVLEEQGVTVKEIEEMLEELQEHVESIDMANDLHAIGGLVPLLNYLKYPDASIRARAAEVVSTVVQNNEKSQQQVMDAKGLELLLHNFTADPDMNVRAKALGAISSLTTNNKAGIAAFRLANCYAGLRDALGSGHHRLQRKALQVLVYLLRQYPNDAKVMVDLGFPHSLTSLVSHEDGGIRQTALQVLVEIIRNGGQAELPEGSNQLKQLLSARIQEIEQYGAEDLAAAKEERHFIDQLWQLSFHEPSSLRTSGLLVSEADESEDVPPGSGSVETATTEEVKTPPLMLLGR